ncbi:GntR family transcriptional regulator [Glutamicibacter protophormiae]|uniref:GntR family transcriptional regulator n=1 Tax=Kocuria TaxID=57493 RepID=UPI000A40E82A|nr:MULTISPECIES: GntR family transcriptional regulator [Kocuria]MDN5631095.1 GntR family transcriptional regulator [Kocuria sp.]WNB88213.1 GntR family transcriptional regulator [Glutamicibacter protophormiae]
MNSAPEAHGNVGGTGDTGGSPAARSDAVQASAHAADRLRAMIADGALAPGTKLSEQAVSGELGISRNTLREAFAMLAAENLVARLPNRGVFVTEPTTEDVRDLYAARLVLEPGAVLWGELEGPALARLREIVAAALAAEEAGDTPAMADANQRFHRELVALGGSHALLTDMDRALARMRLVFHAMTAEPGFHAGYAHRNAEVLSALEAGDRARAVELLRESLVAARDEILSRLG